MKTASEIGRLAAEMVQATTEHRITGQIAELLPGFMEVVEASGLDPAKVLLEIINQVEKAQNDAD